MEKFPNYKAFVQINEAGNGIDIFEADTDLDDPNILKMSIEEAVDYAIKNSKVFYPAPLKSIQTYLDLLLS